MAVSQTSGSDPPHPPSRQAPLNAAATRTAVDVIFDVRSLERCKSSPEVDAVLRLHVVEVLQRDTQAWRPVPGSVPFVSSATTSSRLRNGLPGVTVSLSMIFRAA